MIWWAERPERARAERAEVAELVDRSDWLHDVRWPRRDDHRLVAHFQIEHLGKLIPFTLAYPSYFPDVPPVVAPEEEVRVSGHQYGVGGELCLEWRTDNWHPEVTGAMMIESAWRLLSGEQPEEGERASVQSAHQQTQAQRVRSEKWRMHLTPEVRRALMAQPPMELTELGVEEYGLGKYWLARPVRFGPSDGACWTAKKGLTRVLREDGYVVRLPPASELVFRPHYLFLAALLTAIGDQSALDRLASSDRELPFLVSHLDEVILMTVTAGTGERSVHAYQTIDFPEDENRLGEAYACLAEKSVAIIGNGSIGSKIAASLCRAGVGEFVLVDGDLLFPGNLVRNELDLNGLALNKPDALAERLRAILPSVTIDKRRIALGRQERAEASDAAMLRIGRCDLLIEATADPQVFNLVASVSLSERKPMIWGVVYAGGIGGMIARARPDLDPPPLLARRQIIAWGERNNIPWAGTDDGRYGSIAEEDAPPLIADDADVSVIAAHMTRMALDLLVESDSAFPYSAYAIGLRKSWIFGAPFDTWPIDLADEGSWVPEPAANRSEEFDALVAEMRSDYDETGR